MKSYPHMCRDDHPEVGFRETYDESERCPVCWQRDRAETAEAHLGEARETNKRLNRRCTNHEAGLAEKLEDARRSDGSLGRALANTAAEYHRTRETELRARLTALVDDFGASSGAYPRSVWPPVEWDTLDENGKIQAQRNAAAMARHVWGVCAVQLRTELENP